MQYDLELREASKKYQGIMPETRNMIQGRTSAGRDLQWGAEQRFLVQSGIIRVRAENAEGPGVLPFYLKDVAAVNSQKPCCALTIFDTEGNSARCSFEVPEVIVH